MHDVRMTRSRDARLNSNLAGEEKIRWTCDGFANPYQLHSIWWCNSIDLRREWSQRRQHLRHVLNDLVENGVPPDNTTVAYNCLRMQTSHFMKIWKEVSWNPLAPLPMQNPSSTQHRNFWHQIQSQDPMDPVPAGQLHRVASRPASPDGPSSVIHLIRSPTIKSSHVPLLFQPLFCPFVSLKNKIVPAE